MKNALGAVQRVLLLGGDSDIGIATCYQLIQRGAREIVLAGRHADQLEERAGELRSAGASQVAAVHFDALDFESHGDFVERVFSDYGDFDLVLLMFGLLGDQERDERDAAKAIQVIQVNYTGAVSVLIPTADQLRKQGHGTIVAMSSVAAERARRSNFIYGSSKAGLDWFCQGLGDALQGSGVNVMIVRPGFARSKMTEHMETPPMATDPETVASAIVDGLKNGDELIWVPGRMRWVMTVIRHLPRPLFRRLKV